METMESGEGGVVVRRRRRRALSEGQRNVVIGVATVAGLGLVGKLVAVLRRGRAVKRMDGDVETLESVVGGDGADKSGLPLQARVQRTKLANLDNDEPDHEVVNRKRSSRSSKYVDSFSEIISEDDIVNDGEMYVNQDPVARRDRCRENSRDGRGDANGLKGKQLAPGEGGFNIKGVSHFDDENGGTHDDDEDGGRRRSGDHVGRRRSEDGGNRHHGGGSESPPNRSRKEFTKKELIKKESINTSGSLEKKPRRTSSGEPKQGRKSKSGGEEKAGKRKLKTLPEDTAAKEVKEVIFDEAGRWESVNGFKVLKATTSKIPTFTEAMHKLEADGSISSLGDNVHIVREFERERAETEKAQSIWDGKIHTKKKIHSTEGSEAYLKIKSSVVSSVAGTEETPEGFRVREVVKRSTLLPIPSGDESEVHSSVYNVKETDQGLKVEEVVTRTKLLPAKGDFTLSDEQLLRKTSRKKPTDQFKNLRNDTLVLMLKIIVVLVILLSVLLILYKRNRIPLPFFY